MALVMFDYDGVIVNSLDFFINQFPVACKEMGYEISGSNLLDFMENNIYKGMEKYGLKSSDIDRILDCYKKKLLQDIENIKIFTGMDLALKRIKQNHHVCIITSNCSSVVQNVLRKYDINFIDEILGAEEEKSKYKKIVKTMQEYSAQKAFYVGDTKGDMIEGKKAGAITIGVSWGWHKIKIIREGNPDYIVDTPKELENLLCEI